MLCFMPDRVEGGNKFFFFYFNTLSLSLSLDLFLFLSVLVMLSGIADTLLGLH